LTEIAKVVRSHREAIEVNGSRFIRADVAAMRCGVSVDTVHQWRKNGCSRWRGRKPAAIRERVGDGRRTWLYWFLCEDDVTAIMGALGRDSREFEDSSGERWISAKLAHDRYGYNSQSLLRWRTRGCPALGGKKIASRQRKAPRRRTGLLRLTWFYRESDLTKIAKAREKETKHVDINGVRWVLLETAAQRCGVSVLVMGKWRREGCPLLGNRKLASVQHPIAVKGGNRVSRRVAPRWFIRENDLKQLDAAIRTECLEFVDAHGRWLSAALASERYGFGPEVLRGWSKTGCPALGGRNLSARRRKVPRLGRGNWRSISFYSEQDLKSITAAFSTTDGHTQNGNAHLLTIAEAARRCGVTVGALRQWERNGCPALNGWRLVLKRLPGVMADGKRTLRAVYVREDDVDAILAARTGSKEHETCEVTSKEDSANSDNGQVAALGRPKKRGRKIDTDVDEDRRIFQAWDTGCYKVKSDLARELGKSTKHVKRAIDRHRKRARGQPLGLEKMP